MNTIDKLRIAVAEKLGIEADEIGINEVIKNNGIKRTGFAVKTAADRNVEAGVYVEDLIEKIETFEIDIEHAASDIVSVLQNEQFTGSAVFNRGMVLDRSYLQIVNADSNAEMLKNVPHRLIEDLAVIVKCIVIDTDDSKGSTFVTFDMLDQFGIGIDEMFDAAKKNTLNNSGFRICSIGRMLYELGGPDGYELFDDDGPFVVTSKDKYMGAVAVAFPDLIGSYVEKIGDDVYVLPSSIHEVLLMKKSTTDDLEYLKRTVMSINRSMLSPEEVLSDNVYEFCLADRRLKIAG